AFGWYVQRVDGNDLAAVIAAFDNAKSHAGNQPRVILCDTLMGQGVPFLETRDKNHFIRVDADEWQKAIAVLDANKPEGVL
ncbi:transketolase, partial [Salmonella enterica subsp. enterica serovar Give]|nr:transketolase [Salmonella enterica subsp. enterica serovar Give]